MHTCVGLALLNFASSGEGRRCLLETRYFFGTGCSFHLLVWLVFCYFIWNIIFFIFYIKPIRSLPTSTSRIIARGCLLKHFIVQNRAVHTRGYVKTILWWSKESLRYHVYKRYHWKWYFGLTTLTSPDDGRAWHTRNVCHPWRESNGLVYCHFSCNSTHPTMCQNKLTHAIYVERSEQCRVLPLFFDWIDERFHALRNSLLPRGRDPFGKYLKTRILWHRDSPHRVLICFSF